MQPIKNSRELADFLRENGFSPYEESGPGVWRKPMHTEVYGTVEVAVAERPFEWDTGNKDYYIAVRADSPENGKVVLNEVSVEYGQWIPDLEKYAEHIALEVASHIECGSIQGRPQLDKRVLTEPLASLVHNFHEEAERRADADEEAKAPRP